MKQVLLLLFISLFVYACKEKDPIKIGDTNTSVQLIDTFSVKLSTVFIDSLPTSASDRLLVGKLNNVGMGEVIVSSYFQISLDDKVSNTAILAYSTIPVYDSLVLILNHTYSYGDTTIPFLLSVNRVNEVMDYKNGSSYLYNSTHFSYDQTSLATQLLDFRNTNETHIKLSDVTGSELFSLAKDNDYRITTNENLKNYFKGIALLPSASVRSVFGFETEPVLRLYYHDQEAPSESLQYEFSTKSTDLYTNRIYNDRSGTAISSFNERYQEISAGNTSNEAYLLTGVELMPKIKFPTLNDLKTLFPFSAVNRAELVIHPKKHSYDQKYYLPGRLVLYNTNSSNIPGSAITSTLTLYTEIVTPKVDWESQEQTYYTFEVTDFVVNKLNNSDSEASLLLASLSEESGGRVERLILSENNYDVKLRIYLTSFK